MAPGMVFTRLFCPFDRWMELLISFYTEAERQRRHPKVSELDSLSAVAPLPEPTAFSLLLLLLFPGAMASENLNPLHSIHEGKKKSRMHYKVPGKNLDKSLSVSELGASSKG